MKPVPADAFAREISPTAANAQNRLYGPSGEMRYLVILATQGGGQKGEVVTAATGDDAAAAAVAKHPGWKCVYVGPAADAPSDVSDAMLAA